jgi:dienelactone hydrolase
MRYRTLDTMFYPAPGKTKNVAILFLGGSDGGFPCCYDYKKFTDAGYSSLAVAYFKTENTPEVLEMIPLEYFEKAIKWFKSQPEVQGKKIVIYGTSKGGELALVLASKFPQIEGVIARVPASVVFQSINPKSQWESKSSWSYEDKPLPFVPYAPYDDSKVGRYSYVELYKLSLKQSAAVSAAVIEVESINGPILLLSGKEDTIWPSTQIQYPSKQKERERTKKNVFRKNILTLQLKVMLLLVSV